MTFPFSIGLSWPTLIALYFIVWWVSLFAVLPLGVQNAEEAGEVREAYADPGAPVSTTVTVSPATRNAAATGRV